MSGKTKEEIEALKKIGIMGAEIRDGRMEETKPGMTTKEIEEFGGRLFKEKGAISAPIAEYDFPGNTCISVDNEVAHGIPGHTRIWRRCAGSVHEPVGWLHARCRRTGNATGIPAASRLVAAVALSRLDGGPGPRGRRVRRIHHPLCVCPAALPRDPPSFRVGGARRARSLGLGSWCR